MTLSDASLLIRAGLDWLPARMGSTEAHAMLLAIGAQESGWKHRRQMGNGPARGWFQFEPVGVQGVLMDARTGHLARDVCIRLHVPLNDVYEAIQYSDTLAVVLARLLLWRVPERLPGPDDDEDGWQQYLSVWRPGKPKPATWPGHYRAAWDHLEGVA